MTALGFPGGLDGKASTWNVEDPGSIKKKKICNKSLFYLFHSLKITDN